MVGRGTRPNKYTYEDEYDRDIRLMDGYLYGEHRGEDLHDDKDMEVDVDYLDYLYGILDEIGKIK